MTLQMDSRILQPILGHVVHVSCAVSLGVWERPTSKLFERFGLCHVLPTLAVSGTGEPLGFGRPPRRSRRGGPRARHGRRGAGSPHLPFLPNARAR